MYSVSKVRRRSGVPSNAITERERRRERRLSSLSSCCTFLLSVARARARPRAGRGVESRREDTLFRVFFHLAARVHDYDAPVPYNRPSMRELRGLGHAVGSRDPPSFSPARIVRGGGRARARAPLREITAGTPLIPGRRRRRRETALTPLRSSSSFI